MTRRKAIIERARLQLQQAGAPRLEMSLIMLLTAGTGFLAAFSFLHLGLDRMAIRYPLAVLLAYGAFLLYLWLWLGYRRSRMDVPEAHPEPRNRVRPNDDARADEETEAKPRRRTGDSDVSWLNLGDGVRLPYLGQSGSGGGGFAGEGGSFGGGGASGSFDTPGASGFVAGASTPSPVSAADREGSGVGDFISDLDVDDDFAKVLILLVVVIAILFLTVYIIYIAPGLLAEVLVDGVLVTGLYRHLNKEERRHWLATALRKTWWYFLAVALLLMVAGALMQTWYPEAQSIGDVWQALSVDG